MGLPTHQITPLDLYLVLEARAPFRGRHLRTFTQKIIFRAEYEGVQAEAEPVFPLFEFVRYDHGPFSKSVYEAEQVLSRLRLIDANDGPVTVRGRSVLRELQAAIDDYTELRSSRMRVEHWGREYARKSLGAVLDDVYQVKVRDPLGDYKAVADLEYEFSVLVPPRVDLSPYQEIFDLIWWKLTCTEEDSKAMDRVHSLEESERFFVHEADVIAALQA